MTSGERMKAVVEKRRPDRIPFIPMALGFCAKNVGYSIADIYENPEKSFWAQVWTQEMYGYDGSPSYIYGSYGAWEFGGEIRFPKREWEQAPLVERFPVESEEDAWKLELPDLKTSGSIPLTFEFFKLCKRYHMPILAPCGSPFTWAANLCGVEKFCRWMMKKPEVAHKLLRVVTDHLVQVAQYWVDNFGEGRVSGFSVMPTEANQVISPKQFEVFAFPYQKEAHEKLLQIGVSRFLCHVCGEHNLNLPYLAQVPMGDGSILGFGHEVKLTAAIKYFGDSCIIGGNVEPAIIQNGTPQQVYELSKECIEEAKYSPRGFVLMPGCELPPQIPPYNVYVMKKAVSDFGWYD
jgi:uroporphyrinogen decarboxylase